MTLIPYTDHLGNVALLGWTGGLVVPGSHAFYDPFGSLRAAPTATNSGLTAHLP